MNNKRLIKKYNRLAKNYTTSVNTPALANYRKKIIKNASGEVLEVGVGSGVNFSFYNKEKVQVTGIDFSQNMIKYAEKAAFRSQVKAIFSCEDVESLSLEANSYDCIISTLTLCSYRDPVETLNNFNKWCRKDGFILLMEHGLSTNKAISTFQYLINPVFHKLSGCHCNRNIIRIIKKSEIELTKVERHMSGIINLIWAKPVK
ncbi:class I SAM-dependent methyltransferase [Shouchella xiaoxiensis]